MRNLRPDQTAGFLICILAIAVMTGWWTRQQILVQLLPGLVAMVFNAALCFLLAGIAILLPKSKSGIRRNGQQAAGALIILIAGAAGLQNLLDVDFKIDQLFAAVWLADPSPHPGRLAPLTSVAFVLVGACFVAAQWLRISKAAQIAVQLLAMAVIALGIFGLIGYPLKLELFYGWYRFVRMAPHTAFGFIVLGAAIWIDWYRTLKQSGAYDDREDKRIFALASIILLAMSLTAGLVGFVLSANRTEAALKHNLESAHTNRTQFLEFLINDGLKQSASLASDPQLLQTLRDIRSKPLRRHDVATQSGQHLPSDVFSAVAVYSSNGEKVLQAGNFAGPASLELQLSHDAVLLWNQHAILQVKSPILHGGENWGTAITQRPLPIIDKLISNARLLGETAELVICTALSHEKMRCLPTQLNAQGFIEAPRRHLGKTQPVSLALDGNAGVTHARDYRGQPVLAAYGAVSDTGMGVVLKVDTVELYAPIRTQLQYIFGLLMLLVFSGLALLRWQLIPLVAALLQAKKESSANEAKIRAVVDNIADGLITIDECGRIESINPAAAAMFGYTLDEVAGKKVEMIIPPDHRTACAEGALSYIRTGETDMTAGSNMEIPARRKDGSEFPMQITVRKMQLHGRRLFVGIARDITDRKQAEADLRYSQERFSKVFQSSPVGICISGFDDGRYIEVNNEMLNMLGYRRDEMIGHTALELGVWADPREREQALARLTRQSSIKDLEVKLVRKSGEVRDMLFAVEVLELQNRRHLLVSFHDITDRKTAEAMLKESEARFSKVFNMSPVAISVTRMSDGRYLHVNDAFCRILDYSREELIGATSLGLNIWISAEERAAVIARTMEQGPIRNFEMRLRTKSGRIIDVLVSLDVIALIDNEPYLLFLYSDITERKRAERALRENEEKFRSIVETTKDWIWSTDHEGKLSYSNPAVEMILGYKPEELLGADIVQYLHPEVRDTAIGQLQVLRSVKKGWNSWLGHWRHKDGSDRYLESTAVPILSDDGKFLGHRGTDHDITSLKQYQQALQVAKEKAESANKTKSEFLANMSHEIRTPMNGVIGVTNLMLKTSLSQQQHEYMAMVKTSADSLLGLLNDILDFSKMEAGKLDLDHIEFDLRENIGNTLKALSTTAHEKGLELIYHVTPSVPFSLLGDPGRLTQIVVNLVGNAVKFTSRGEVVVRVNQESYGNTYTVLRFSVSDTGIGISKEQQSHIFDAFSQADSSTTRQYGGTGLGLTIVRQLIALMDGTIWLDSEPGKGTTFHFTIRLALPKSQPVRAIQPPATLNSMPVLVVDDNRTNRLILEEILNNWGMAPVLAANGEQALTELLQAAVLDKPFRLALVDSQMPGFDGFELAKAIKATPALHGATIMMLSSTDLSREIERCKSLGIMRFLRKPVKQSELFNAIVTALGIIPDVQAHEESQAAMQAQMPAVRAARSLHVLVAEDHPINQRLVTQILAERGHSFAVAGNGFEALQLHDQQEFDVILMDGQMPEMDGYQAAQEIRRREQSTGKHVRIIAVTAHAMKQDRERCLAAGMDDYVSKPIDPDYLLQRLEAGSGNAIGRLGKSSVRYQDKTVPVAAFDFGGALKRARGKHALVVQLVQVFLEDLPNTLTEIDTAVQAKDATRVERAAHRLKGGAATLAAGPVAQAAAKLEQLCRNDGFDRAQEAIEELKARTSELILELETIVEGSA
jgi:PAS domain S-box-containing protein